MRPTSVFLSLAISTLFAASLGAAGGCDDGTATPEPAEPTPAEPEPTGQFQGPCHADGTCDFGLDCVSNVCVDLSSEPDTGEPSVGPGEPEPGPGEPGVVEPDPEPACEDRDNDGAGAMPCGNDCDDNDDRRAPGNEERCSFIDENCNGVNNENLDCTFTAHGPDTLYRVNPFVPSIDFLSDANLPGNGGMLDIDIDIAGNTVAVLADGLYDLDDNGNMSLISAVETPERTNGMAISAEGTIYLTNSDRNGGPRAYTVDRNSGVVTELGDLAPYESSGDCVILKDGSLLMSAPHPDDPNSDDPEGGDVLVRVDRATGTTSLIGDLPVHDVYGLSASFGFLFGVTDGGVLLQIDPADGSSLILLETDEQFWGAANGD